MGLMTASVTFIMTLSSVVTATDYCQWEKFKATCKRDEVVMIRSALYGRMKHTDCIERNYGYIGCSNNVLEQADTKCSGRHSCEIEIPYKGFTDTACPKDLRRYLQAEYDCMQVITPAPGVNCFGTPIPVTSSSGYLSTVVTEETGCGSSQTPWLIQTKPGQSIRFTLWDFSLATLLPNGTEVQRPAPSDLHRLVYVILKEQETGSGKTVCGGIQRRQEVYLSTASQVQVRLFPGERSQRHRHFVLHFEAVGCADPPADIHTWIQREGTDTVHLGCTGIRGSRWTLTCEGNKWTGERGNCSTLVARSASNLSGKIAIPQTLSVVVILAVAIVIGSIILLIGIVCIRKRRAARQRDHDNRAVKANPKTMTGKVDAMGDFYPPQYTESTATPSFLVRQDTSENEYEYVDDLKLPTGPPLAPPPAHAQPPPPPPVPCAVHGGSRASHVMDYGFGTSSVRGGPPPKREPSHSYNPALTTSSTPGERKGAPQYYELDPHVSEPRGDPSRGLSCDSHVRAGGTGPGHYSQ